MNNCKYSHIFCFCKLGNVRAVISSSYGPGAFTQTQASDYYPFGMALTMEFAAKAAGKALTVIGEVVDKGETDDSKTFTRSNAYLYNGKEEQPMPGKWLDYGARFYDAQLGRWHSVDPLAEERSWVSSFSYCQNDPINRIDPDGMYDDWVERDNKIVWDENITSATDKDLKSGDKYLGKEGYSVNEATGQITHYQADGTKHDYTQTLSALTVTPDNAYSTVNPSMSTHNQTGYIWDDRDLDIWNRLKNNDSPIGSVLRRQVSTGRFNILSATNYWNTYGHTLGNLMLFQQYFDMVNVVSSYSAAKLNSNGSFNLKPTYSKPAISTQNKSALNNGWNSTKPTFNEFRSTNKGSFKGYKGRGESTKAAWEAYKQLYGN